MSTPPRPILLTLLALAAGLILSPARADEPVDPTASPPVSAAADSAAPPVEPPAELPTMADGIALPAISTGDSTVELARALLPKSFRRNRSSSHVVYSDADWDSLTHVRNILRRAWSEYRGFCRRVGVVVPRPDERLVCIVFAQQEDFLAFAKKTEGPQAMMEHAGGYFSPRFDWIVFFEPGNHGGAEQHDAELEHHQRELDEARRSTNLNELDEATADRLISSWEFKQKQIDRARENLQAWLDATRTSVTIHEAIHQFTHVCHTWPGKDRWPVWLHEGLATAFETGTADRGFGPDRLVEDMDNSFLTHFDAGRVTPLRAFLAQRDYGEATRQALSVFYDQSYALVTWLYEYRTPKLAEYLRRLAASPEDEGVHDPVLLFEDVFGDIEKLEQRWHRLEATGWRGKKRR